jgi:hypothetical protein
MLEAVETATALDRRVNAVSQKADVARQDPVHIVPNLPKVCGLSCL